MYPIDFKTINENIVNTKQKYCEVLKMKGLVDSCVDLSPGLKMKNTEILDGNFAHIEKISSLVAVRCTTILLWALIGKF